MTFKENFSYWFSHWCAYQMVAINLKCWKWRFLLHDWYKPWLELIMEDHKVTFWHRKLSNHHPEDDGNDYLAMVIDWECAKYTKPNKQLNARETMNRYYPNLKDKVEPILDKLNL